MDVGLRLIALGAALGALCPPLGAAPAPPLPHPRRCPFAAPPPPPTPPPLPPDCDNDSDGDSAGGAGGHRGDSNATAAGDVSMAAATPGDVIMEGTEDPSATGDPKDTWGHLGDISGSATTVVAPVTVSPGSGEVLAATSDDVIGEGREDPSATAGPGDTLGHLNDITGSATTAAGLVMISPGGDKVLVATPDDVTEVGTEDPSATAGPGDTWGHLGDVTGSATTMVGLVTVSPGSGEVLAATSDDVIGVGTEDPSATGGRGDTLGHLGDVTGSATTPPGSDKLLVATSDDVIMAGTDQPRATNCSGDTLGHVLEVDGDVTTAVASVTVSPGGDKVLVATPGDVTMEGTEDPSATSGPRDTLGHLNDVTGSAATMAGLVTVSPGSGEVLAATSDDVIGEGTEDPSATGGPGDTLGHLNDVTGSATTAAGLVTVSPGGDKVLVATPGDVTMKGTEDPSATGDPKDTLGHLGDVTGSATTAVGLVTVSPGGDKVLVATSDDIIGVGTEDPSATSDPRDTLGHLNDITGSATIAAGLVTVSPGSDKLLVATSDDVIGEGTDQPRATNCSGDTLGHVLEVDGDVTTAVASVTVSPGGDKVLVATPGDVIGVGTEDPSATGGPGDTLGHLSDVTGSATTAAGLVTVSPGSGEMLVATSDDVIGEGTEDPSATGGPGDTVGHLNDVTGSATTPPGSDKVLAATAGDVIGEGTEDPSATSGRGDTLGHLGDVTGSATTAAGLVTISPGGDKVLVATPDDVTMEGTEDPSATGDPRDTLGHLGDISGSATTMAGLVTVSPGGDKVLAATSDDIIEVGTEDPSATTGPGDTLGHLGDVTGSATSPPGSGDVLAATSDDVIMAGTDQPRATNCSGETLAHLSDVTGSATTAAATTSAGSDNAGDVALEGTEPPKCSGEALAHLNDVTGSVTTSATSSPASTGSATPASTGSDAPEVAHAGDMALEGTEPLSATNCSGESLARLDDVTGSATTAVPTGATPTGASHTPTPPRGDAIMVAPGGDIAVGAEGRGGDVTPRPPCRPPARGDVTPNAFPVTAPAPPPRGPPGVSGSAPSPTSPLPLIPLLLPLPLLLLP